MNNSPEYEALCRKVIEEGLRNPLFEGLDPEEIQNALIQETSKPEVQAKLRQAVIGQLKS